jgi:hypothetical protein
MKIAVKSLPVQFFREGDAVVAYCAALDLSTCGQNLAEARRNFIEAVTLFFEECRQRGTLEAALLACGWQEISRHGRRQLRPPPLVKLEEVPLPVMA